MNIKDPRICGCCEKLLPASEFGLTFRILADGSKAPYRRAKCLACRRLTEKSRPDGGPRSPPGLAAFYPTEQAAKLCAKKRATAMGAPRAIFRDNSLGYYFQRLHEDMIEHPHFVCIAYPIPAKQKVS